MGTPRVKIEDIIVELSAEIAGINADIDRVNEQIRANEKVPASRQEIESALHKQLDQGAARYREKLRFTLKTFAPDGARVGPSMQGLPASVRRAVRDNARIDLLPIRDVNVAAAAGMPAQTDYQMIADGFCFLAAKIGQPLIDDLMAIAPSDGISADQKRDNDERLRATKRELEVRLEEICCELEQAGFTPDRRPDLSPAVFLEFDQGKWKREKLERYREGMIGQRGMTSRLQEKRSDLMYDLNQANERIRTQNQAPVRDGELVKQLERRISEITAEQKTCATQIEAANQIQKRSAKLWNECISFLKEQHIEIDHHI